MLQVVYGSGGVVISDSGIFPFLWQHEIHMASPALREKLMATHRIRRSLSNGLLALLAARSAGPLCAADRILAPCRLLC